MKKGDKIAYTDYGAINREDHGTIVSDIVNNRCIIRWEGQSKGAFQRPSFYASRYNLECFDENDSSFEDMGTINLVLNYKKVRNTKLARKMYPDAEIDGEYLKVKLV